jgi:hypothetical protein
MVRRRKTLKEGYKPYICRLVAYIDEAPGGDYARTIEWGQEKLLEITPDAIARYFKKLGYGTLTQGPNDMPTHCRSSNLEQKKEVISFYMHNNKYFLWDVRSCLGNPTKSVTVNDVVNTVRKMECRKQGRPVCSKWDMKREDYRKTMRIIESKAGNFEMQGKVPMMLKFQFHVISRTDNITNIEMGGLRSHNKFGAFALQTKVSWSKNVMEDCSCPDQIFIGAADTNFCMFLALVCYL